MAYLIDTDVLSDYLGGDRATKQLFDQFAELGISVSMVTYMEAFQGALRSPDPMTADAKLHAFLSGIVIFPFSEDVARRCARLREHLMQHNKRVRSRALDLITAATAIEHGLTLVTRNTADYHDVPGLLLH